jgi:outer membrane protein
MARRIALLSILLLAVCVGLPAARAETLQQAWQLAAEHDAALAATRSTQQAAEAQLRAARAARWPSLTVGGSVDQLQRAPAFSIATGSGTLVSPPLFAANRVGIASAELSVPLYTSGRIQATVQAASAGAAVAADAQRGAAQDLRFAVAEAYIQVLRTRAALRVAQSQAASLQAHAADAQRLYSAQSVALTDVLSARVALANADQSRLRAQNAVQLALATYNRLLGQDLSRVPELDEQLPPIAPDLTGASLQALTQRALRERPELAAASQSADAYQQQARAQSAGRGPQLALNLGYYHFDNDFLNRQDFGYVGVGLRWTLFDGGQARERADSLRSTARAEQQQLQDLRSRVELQVQQAWLDRTQAAARQSSANAAVSQAEENLRVTRQLYEAGAGTSTQVLDAEALRAAALSNRDEAHFDLALAQFELAHAAGEL